MDIIFTVCHNLKCRSHDVSHWKGGTIMLITLIQKEVMHHILSARFVSLLVMCILLIPLNFHINYHRYLQRQVDYQETVKDENDKDPAEQPSFLQDGSVSSLTGFALIGCASKNLRCNRWMTRVWIWWRKSLIHVIYPSSTRQNP